MLQDRKKIFGERPTKSASETLFFLQKQKGSAIVIEHSLLFRLETSNEVSF